MRIEAFALWLGLAGVTTTGCAGATPASQTPASATSTVVSLQGIDCLSCGTKVVDDLKARPGVYEASFDAVTAEVSVAHEASQVSVADILGVVKSHGFVGIEGAGHGAYVPAVAFDEGLDVREIAADGAVVDLEANLVAGKVTVFDYYAAWCKPCREVDRHMKDVLAAQPDVALRKLDVVDWDSPLAKSHLVGVQQLPYLVVYGADGRRVAKISGLKLDEIDAAIAKGRR
jgi:thiol-disulfide isomerase/thioredoxin